jgi:tRNA G37 N-methylase Trm5
MNEKTDIEKQLKKLKKNEKNCIPVQVNKNTVVLLKQGLSKEEIRKRIKLIKQQSERVQIDVKNDAIIPNLNTLKKAKKIKELTLKHYEPGRQDRCKLWVYNNVVKKEYPMSERTFFRYLIMDTSILDDTDDMKEGENNTQ